MSVSKAPWLAVGIASIALAVAATRLAGAAAPTVADLADKEGIFVNKKTFQIVRRMSTSDPDAQISKLGARPVTEGAIIFRSGDKLYIVDAVPGGGTMDLMFEGAFAPPG